MTKIIIRDEQTQKLYDGVTLEHQLFFNQLSRKYHFTLFLHDTNSVFNPYLVCHSLEDGITVMPFFSQKLAKMAYDNFKQFAEIQYPTVDAEPGILKRTLRPRANSL